MVAINMLWMPGEFTVQGNQAAEHGLMDEIEGGGVSSRCYC